MNVLVTGGCGFIGSNLVHKLVENMFDVIVLDDMFLGKKENLSELPKEKVKIVDGSVTDIALVENLAKHCDVIFHLAAVSSAPLCERSSLDALKVNVDGFINVLEVARKQKINRVVYASTSSLYNNLAPPHREDMVVKPGTLYEASKYTREIYGKIYYENYGIETVGLRFFSVYGPKEQHKGRYANMITQFLWSALKGEKSVIYGDGTQTRDFIYVDDVVNAMMLASQAENVGGEVFNVGVGKNHSFNEIIEILSETLGAKLKVEYVKNPIKKYVTHTLADTRKAKNCLGFEAKIKSKDGTRNLVDFYRKRVQ